MEEAANELVKYYRRVLVYAAYDNYVRIRFRADNLQNTRCYFNRVPSQHAAWQLDGGTLITWRSDHKEGPHEAIVFAECPRSLNLLHEAIKDTKHVGVIYQPPSWRYHEQKIAKRFKDKNPRKGTRAFERLEHVKLFMSGIPEFTSERLQEVIRVQREVSQALSSRASPEAWGHSPRNSS